MAVKKKDWRCRKGEETDVHSAHRASPCFVSRSLSLMLLSAGLVAGFSLQARAEPQANHVLSNCTFTTNTVEGTNLQDALNIPDLGSLNGGQLEASYIIIYVRQNPNNGQLIGPPPASASSTYTGPILCYNVTDSIQTSPEGTAISGPIDILGAEESSHIQIQPSGSTDTNQRQKRVCHTVASNTDCFLIGPGD